MKQLLAITLSALILASAARAQTTADAPQPSQKIVCVRGQADTGSHFGASKVCHTESEWAMIRNQSTRMLEQYDTLQNKQVTPSGGR
jgi:hypothetical protein